MNVCIHCGNIKFHLWSAYRDHMHQMHDIHVKAQIKPVKISNRTTAEIIRDVEAKWGQRLIASPNI